MKIFGGVYKVFHCHVKSLARMESDRVYIINSMMYFELNYDESESLKCRLILILLFFILKSRDFHLNYTFI